MPLGLSSLGRCEARVLANLDAVIASLAAVAGDGTGSVRDPPSASAPSSTVATASFAGTRRRSSGPTPAGRQVRIMVTLPGDAAEEYGFVRDLVASGAPTSCGSTARTTVADEWVAMAAQRETCGPECGRSCKVLIDLEGPRVRTGRVAGRADEVRVGVGDRVRLVAGRRSERPTRRSSSARCRRPSRSSGPGTRSASTRAGSASSPRRRPERDALLRVTRVESKGRLRSDKGLNFPDTELQLDPLTAEGPRRPRRGRARGGHRRLLVRAERAPTSHAYRRS